MVRKAVLFDLDETLLDRKKSLEDFIAWQSRELLNFSTSKTETFLKKFVELDANGKVWKDVVYTQLINEFEIKDWTASELLQSYVLDFSNFCQAKEGALSAIQELKRQEYQLGLVSNGKSPFQEQNFNALGMSNFFDSVIVSEAVGFRKPQKEIFELACKELGVQTSQCVFVGDNPVADIDGAKACGMYTVYIPGYFGESYAKADAICSSYSTLVDIVKVAFLGK